MSDFSIKSFFREKLRLLQTTFIMDKETLSETRQDFIDFQANLKDTVENEGRKKDEILNIVNNNIININLYYDDMLVAIIEQKESFTIYSLISEIGGCLGLFLGASILSICEIIDYIFFRSVLEFKTRKCK